MRGATSSGTQYRFWREPLSEHNGVDTVDHQILSFIQKKAIKTL